MVAPLATQYIITIFLYILAYAYALKFAVWAQTCPKPWCKSLVKAQESCLLSRKGMKYNGRGNNYYIGVMDAAKKQRLQSCVATFWSLAHFILYFGLGFFAPSLFWPTFFLGAAFEVYEYKAYLCHDLLDVFYNSAGFLVGRWFSFL